MGLILSERQTMNNPSKELQFNLAGHWLITKFKARAQESGYYAAAMQLRKQGVPLWLARLVLLGS